MQPAVSGDIAPFRTSGGACGVSDMIRLFGLLAIGVALFACACPAVASDAAIFAAAQTGDRAAVEQLLTADPAALSARDATRQTPLHRAVLASDPAVCKLLLDRGADVNATDKDGNTPLHVAARSLRAEAAKQLLAARANPTLKNARGEISMNLVIYSGDNTRQAATDRLALARAMLAAGASPSVEDDAGMRALHFIALKGRDELLVLAFTPADINAPDAAGRTPLHYAALGNHTTVINWLLDHAADIRAVDKLGETPLHAAARRFRADAITRLLDAGADVNARGKNGDTPLMLLAKNPKDADELDAGLVAAAELLIARRATVDAKDATGMTPLRAAEANEHPKLAELLRKHGGAS